MRIGVWRPHRWKPGTISLPATQSISSKVTPSRANASNTPLLWGTSKLSSNLDGSWISHSFQALRCEVYRLRSHPQPTLESSCSTLWLRMLTWRVRHKSRQRWDPWAWKYVRFSYFLFACTSRGKVFSTLRLSRSWYEFRHGVAIWSWANII